MALAAGLRNLNYQLTNSAGSIKNPPASNFKKLRNMKKVALMMVVALFAGVIAKAQDIPERRQQEPRLQRSHDKKWAMKDLNLTDEQKTKFKAQQEDFRKQMEDLKKNDNITVKEYRTRMETLRKEHQAKWNEIYTPEQKEKMANMKRERAEKRKADNNARMEKMKTRLNLTDEQVAKMKKNHEEMGEKFKALREDKNLGEDQKRDKMKELMKEQKEKTKSILTKEQQEKMKEKNVKNKTGVKKNVI